MAVVLSFQNGTNPPVTMCTIGANTLAALDAYRKSLVDLKQTVVGGVSTSTSVVRYATIQDMILGEVIKHVLTQALAAFPPAPVTAAYTALQAAQAVYDAALVSTAHIST